MTFEQWSKSEGFLINPDETLVDTVLVRACRSAWEAATEAERECCAQVAEQAAQDGFANNYSARNIADQIRQGA